MLPLDLLPPGFFPGGFGFNLGLSLGKGTLVEDTRLANQKAEAAVDVAKASGLAVVKTAQDAGAAAVRGVSGIFTNAVVILVLALVGLLLVSKIVDRATS